jgi:hypothetical protein
MKILAASRSVLFRTAAVATLIVIAVCPSFSKRKDDVVIMCRATKNLASIWSAYSLRTTSCTADGWRAGADPVVFLNVVFKH